MASLPSLGLNQYQRTAQLYPAILVMAPALSLAAVWAPKALGLVKGAGSIGVVGALTILLIQIGRQRGRAVETRWNLGFAETVAALRHGATILPAPTLARYHAALAGQGLLMPSADDQGKDSAVADAAYAAAVLWLRDRTRDEKKYFLIHIENRNYGFRRNLLGLKPIGLGLCGGAAVLDLGLALTIHRTGDTETAAWILFAALVGGVAAWSFIVTRRFVTDASRSYAVQLLAASEQVVYQAKGGGRRQKAAGD